MATICSVDRMLLTTIHVAMAGPAVESISPKDAPSIDVSVCIPPVASVSGRATMPPSSPTTMLMMTAITAIPSSGQNTPLVARHDSLKAMRLSVNVAGITRLNRIARKTTSARTAAPASRPTNQATACPANEANPTSRPAANAASSVIAAPASVSSSVAPSTRNSSAPRRR